jgi:hypothetical protein
MTWAGAAAAGLQAVMLPIRQAADRVASPLAGQAHHNRLMHYPGTFRRLDSGGQRGQPPQAAAPAHDVVELPRPATRAGR